MFSKQFVKDIFDRVCGTQRQPRIYHPLWLFIRQYQRVILTLREFVTGWVLDIGAGDRYFEYVFQEGYSRYVALDYPVTRTLHGGTNLPSPDIAGDGRELPIKSGTFNTVFLFEVLEHCPYPHQIFHEAFRILKPGGYLLISAPFTVPEHSPPHDYYRYTQYGLRHLLEEANFTVERLTPICSIGGIIAYYFNYALLEGTFSKSSSLVRGIKILGFPTLLMVWMFMNTCGFLLDTMYFKEGFVLDYCVVARKGALTDSSLIEGAT